MKDFHTLATYVNDWYATLPMMGEKRKRVQCPDGFSVSIQVSDSDDDIAAELRGNEWISFELGFPSQEEPMLTAYMDWNPTGDMTKGVFRYVPYHVVYDLLLKHKLFK